MDETVVQCDGWLRNLGNNERRKNVDNGVNRECDPDNLNWKHKNGFTHEEIFKVANSRLVGIKEVE